MDAHLVCPATRAAFVLGNGPSIDPHSGYPYLFGLSLSRLLASPLLFHLLCTFTLRHVRLFVKLMFQIQFTPCLVRRVDETVI